MSVFRGEYLCVCICLLATSHRESAAQTILYRINTGGPAYTDPQGNQWAGETQHACDQVNPYLKWPAECPTVCVGDPGSCRTKTLAEEDLLDEDRQCRGAIRATMLDELYLTERFDSQKLPEMIYGFAVDAMGQYRVRLHFAEFYWGVRDRRVFNVAIEGRVVLPDYDIVTEVGPCTADIQAFETEVTDGELEIAFTHICPDCTDGVCGCTDPISGEVKPSLDNPKISGIEIERIAPAPIIDDGASEILTVNESSVCADAPNHATLSSTDAGGNPATLQWTIKTPPLSGAVAFVNGVSQGPSVELCYQPTPGVVGADRFTVRVLNGRGDSDEILMRVTIEPVPPPTMTCPPDTAVRSGQPTAPAAVGTPTVTDALDPSPQVTFSDATSTGVCPVLQTIRRTWSAKNRFDKTNTCDQIIVVNGADSDADGVADCQDRCPGANDTTDANQNGTPDCLEQPGGNNPGGNNPGGTDPPGGDPTAPPGSDPNAPPGGQPVTGVPPCCGGSVMMMLPATMLGWTWIRRRGRAPLRG